MSQAVPQDSLIAYDIEQQIISELLANPDFFWDWSNELSSSMFVKNEFKTIYLAIAELTKDYISEDKTVPYDVFSIIDLLQKKQTLEAVGGQERIFALHGKGSVTKSEKGFAYLVDALIAYEYRRRLVAKGREIEELGADLKLSQADLRKSVSCSVESLEYYKSTDTVSLVAEHSDRVYDFIMQGVTKGISTGFSLCDRLIGGFKPGKVYILGARTGMGKTNMAVHFATQIAKFNPEKHPVLFLSAEMSLESLSIRFIARLSGVNSSNIANDYMSHEERADFEIGFKEFKQLGLIIDESSAQTLDGDAISSKLRSAIKHHGGVSAVIIDYIQLLGDLSTPRRDLAIGEVIRACKDMSKRFKVPFIVLAQVKRDVETRSDKRPVLSDLKDSGSLEQAADLIMYLYRDEYYTKNQSDAPGITELIIAKNRDGGTGTITLEHELSTCLYVQEKNTFSINR